MKEMIAEIVVRQPLRDELAALTASFMNAGGQIELLSHCEYKPLPPRPAVDHYPQRANKRRREQGELRRLTERARAMAVCGATSLQAMRTLRENWTGKTAITTGLLEQLAAKDGFEFAERGKG